MLIAKRTQVFFRLELAEAMRSKWLWFTAVTYSLVFGGFVWLGMRESTVLGFTGMSRVVLHVSNAMVLTVPLVALVATHQSLVRARATGHLELFLSQPCARHEWIRAAALARVVVLVGPIVVLFAFSLAYAIGEGALGTLGPMVARSLLVVGSLAWAFIGLGFLVSSVSKSGERATVLALLAWLGSAMLHDFALIGVLLRWKIAPQIVFGLAAANPAEAARIAILSAIDPELSVLGPVGFWIANRLGSGASLAFGVLWPLVFGTLAYAWAERRMSHADVVG
jgi:ABC-2 type transport system permease protein